MFEYLGSGKEQAMSARDLARLAGTTKRGVSLEIERERRQGYPICATSNAQRPGYYIPEDKAEMLAYCGRLLHRFMEVAATLEACQAIARSMPDVSAEDNRRRVKANADRIEQMCNVIRATLDECQETARIVSA